jgi:Protein of unknown function (DUF3892)
MANYKISGVWKNADNVITHYAFHTVLSPTSVSRATKKSKAQAIELLEIQGNSAVTWLWNYKTSNWENGAAVEVVNSINGKYLRTNHDNKVVDNLAHLINYDWISA